MSIVDFPQQGTIGTSLKPKRYDIELYQGDDFAFDLIFKDSLGALIDVTEWDATVQIRKISDNSPAETPAMSVMVGGVDGKITVYLTNSNSAALDGDTEYKYDVQVMDAVSKRTYIGGKITVTEDITENV
jgi:hypothetical protein